MVFVVNFVLVAEVNFLLCFCFGLLDLFIFIVVFNWRSFGLVLISQIL